jgi:hypothetical protein
VRFRSYLFLSLLLLSFSLGLRAQTYVPWCTAEMLDVHLLLPSESSDGRTSAHLLVLDLRNRGKELCTLIDFAVHLPIQDGYSNRFGGGVDHSVAAKTLADAQSRMGPGDEVHQVIAWSSVPQTQNKRAYDDCLSSDGLTATIGRNEPVLEVRHLWLEQCGEAWMSSMRAGPFVPSEELSADWLARYGLHRSDIAEPLRSVEPTRLRSFDPIQYLKSTFESGYSGWFVLWLERPAGATADCAFRTLRRREADGKTTFLVNHCAPAKEKSTAVPKRLFEIMLRDYNMSPERVGQVDYESTTELAQNGKAVVAAGITSVEVRNPTDPMLPAIESALKPCRADQLALQATVKLGNLVDIHDLEFMADVPRAGRVYTFTNASQETCLIGGTPELQFLPQQGYPEIKVGLGSCRDCSDALFTARGHHWIALEPAQSAHFIVTGKPVYGIYHSPCALQQRFVVANPAGTMQLDYGLPSCGQIDVSAWRDGAYDDDPLNLRYSLAKSSGSAAPEPPPLPEACAKEVTTGTGRPFMFPSQGPVQFGLSSRPSAFRDNAPLAIWVYNPTDKEVGVMTCGDLDGFFIGGFDVLDQSENRVLAKQEVKAGHTVMRELMACTRNFPINIPPHSCAHGDLDHPGYDFVKNLGSMYTLPAGHYRVVPRHKEGKQRLATTGLAVEITP